jgi:putative hemolysin
MSVPVSSLSFALAAALGGAVFASADAALSSLSTARVAALLEQPDLLHKAALERYRQAPWRLRSTYVVGRVSCAAIAAILLHDAADLILPPTTATVLAVFATLAVMAPLTELGTALVRRNPDTAGPKVATWLRPFELLLYPLAAPLGMATEALADRLRLPEAPTPEVMAAEVEHLVDEVERSGAVGPAPAEMIRNVLEFEDLRARDVMIPRSRVEAFALDTPLAELREIVVGGGHSRYPIYDGQLDNVVGIVSAKDVLRVDRVAAADASIATILRHDVVFVAEQQKISPLLRELRVRRQHLAVVVDEFGGTSGIVTLEDLLEEIVGDIRDEPEPNEEAPIRDLGNGRLDADASIAVGDLCAYLGADIPREERAAALSSLLPERPVPEVGTSIERWGLEFIVREVDSRGVLRLEIRRLEIAVAPSTRPPAIEPAPPTQRARDTAEPPAA